MCSLRVRGGAAVRAAAAPPPPAHLNHPMLNLTISGDTLTGPHVFFPLFALLAALASLTPEATSGNAAPGWRHVLHGYLLRPATFLAVFLTPIVLYKGGVENFGANLAYLTIMCLVGALVPANNRSLIIYFLPEDNRKRPRARSSGSSSGASNAQGETPTAHNRRRRRGATYLHTKLAKCKLQARHYEQLALWNNYKDNTPTIILQFRGDKAVKSRDAGVISAVDKLSDTIKSAFDAMTGTTRGSVDTNPTTAPTAPAPLPAHGGGPFPTGNFNSVSSTAAVYHHTPSQPTTESGNNCGDGGDGGSGTVLKTSPHPTSSKKLTAGLPVNLNATMPTHSRRTSPCPAERKGTEKKPENPAAGFH